MAEWSLKKMVDAIKALQTYSTEEESYLGIYHKSSTEEYELYRKNYILTASSIATQWTQSTIQLPSDYEEILDITGIMEENDSKNRKHVPYYENENHYVLFMTYPKTSGDYYLYYRAASSQGDLTCQITITYSKIIEPTEE